MEIHGTIKQGFGTATRCTRIQKPHFKKLGLPLAQELKAGTLNLDTSPLEFEILNFDYFYEDVEWDENRFETFGFIDIEEIIYNGQVFKKPGYIYVPHGSRHFGEKSFMEIIAKEINSTQYENDLGLVVEEGKVKISYP